MSHASSLAALPGPSSGRGPLTRRAKAAIVVQFLLNEGADIPLSALPDDLQAIVRDVCQAEYDTVSSDFVANDPRALKTLVEDHGVQVRQFPEEILEAGAGAAMEIIAEEGRGIVCLFRQPRRTLYALDEEGVRTIKHTGLGAQILSKLGVHKLVLLRDSPETRYVGLDAYDITIAGTRRILSGD